jgi:hypothetical protein
MSASFMFFDQYGSPLLSQSDMMVDTVRYPVKNNFGLFSHPSQQVLIVWAVQFWASSHDDRTGGDTPPRMWEAPPVDSPTKDR